MRIKILLAVLAVTPLAGQANTTQCGMDGMQRLVSVVYSEPGQLVPCRVLYEKPSEVTVTNQSLTLWRAEHQAGYCEARAEEFVAKLEQLGWQCQQAAAMDNPADPVTPEPAPEEAAPQEVGPGEAAASELDTAAAEVIPDGG